MVALQLVVMSALAAGGDVDNVVLDFSATWCGPCQKMSPVVSRLERQGFPIRKVDVDQERELANRFLIRGIPCFVLVVDGQEVPGTRITGETSEESLKALCARIPQKQPAKAPARGRGIDLGPEGEFDASPVMLVSSSVADANAPKAVVTEETKSPFAKLLGARKKTKPPASLTDGDIRAQKGDLGPEPGATPLTTTVRIRIKDRTSEAIGSGTIIDSKVGRTIILTCGHIFRDWEQGNRIEIDLFRGDRVSTMVGRLLRYELNDQAGLDVGLIEVPTDVALASCRVAPPGMKFMRGMPVISVGCNGGEAPTVQSLQVTAVNRYRGGENLECSGVPVQGRSGGGLFTRDGQVIGVCNAADPSYREGLYAGLATIHRLLDRCNLTGLYQSSGAATDEALVARDAHSRTGADARRNQPAATDVDDESAVGSRGRRVLTSKTRDAGEMLASADAGFAAQADQNLGAALEDAGDAEIVCIIRPKNPKASSRVVVINRASQRFCEYLTDELNDPEAARETSLTADRRAERPRVSRSRRGVHETDLVAERREVRRPAAVSTRTSAWAEIDDSPAGTNAYRRNGRGGSE